MRRRPALSWLALLGIAALTTAAVVSDVEQLDARLVPGAELDLVVAGSATPGWTPTPADWQQANPTAYRIPLTRDEQGVIVGPGGSLTFRVAARHHDEDLPAYVRLTISDPDDRRGHSDPATGRWVELFDQLRITVADEGRVLVDGVGAEPDTLTHSWTRPWAPGEARLLDVTVTVPADLGDAWQDSATDLQITFESESA